MTLCKAGWYSSKANVYGEGVGESAPCKAEWCSHIPFQGTLWKMSMGKEWENRLLAKLGGVPTSLSKAPCGKCLWGRSGRDYLSPCKAGTMD